MSTRHSDVDRFTTWIQTYFRHGYTDDIYIIYIIVKEQVAVLTWINGWVTQAFWYSRYTGAKALFCLAVMGHSPEPQEPASPGAGPWVGAVCGTGGELHVGTAKWKKNRDWFEGRNSSSFSYSFLVCFMSVFDFTSAIYSKGERYAGFNYFTLFLYYYWILFV